MFTSCYLQGCCSHGLHLFVKEMFSATRTREVGQEVSTYPEQYPFELELEFLIGCKDVIKFLYNHHIPKAQLHDLQKAVAKWIF
jgi:hypothetical protein